MDPTQYDYREPLFEDGALLIGLAIQGRPECARSTQEHDAVTCSAALAHHENSSSTTAISLEPASTCGGGPISLVRCVEMQEPAEAARGHGLISF
jgi:hypothetical protein